MKAQPEQLSRKVGSAFETKNCGKTQELNYSAEQSEVKNALDLKPAHRAIVQAILRAHLPANAKVWVFGSRAKATARRGSDLDLALDIGQELPADIASALHFAFEESDLPWTVDIIDMRRLRQGIFRQNIERDRVVFGWKINDE